MFESFNPARPLLSARQSSGQKVENVPVWSKPPHILVAEDWQFTALLISEYVAGDTTFWDPPSPLPATATCEYYWTVTALDGDGNEMEFAETSAFTISVPDGGC